MAAYTKYHCGAKDLAEKKHDCSADTFKILLSNRAPVVATDRVLADVVEIAAGNGYTAGGNMVALVSSAQSSGVYKLVLADPTQWTASGGAIGPFRYAILINATANLVLGFWDYGSSITLQAGEVFAPDLSAVNGVFTIT